MGEQARSLPPFPPPEGGDPFADFGLDGISDFDDLHAEADERIENRPLIVEAEIRPGELESLPEGGIDDSLEWARIEKDGIMITPDGGRGIRGPWSRDGRP